MFLYFQICIFLSFLTLCIYLFLYPCSVRWFMLKVYFYFSVYFCMYGTCVWRLEEAIGSTGAGITVSCEPPDTKNKPRSSTRAPSALKPWASLQPMTIIRNILLWLCNFLRCTYLKSYISIVIQFYAFLEFLHNFLFTPWSIYRIILFNFHVFRFFFLFSLLSFLVWFHYE